LTEDKVLEIQYLYSNNYKISEISNIVGIKIDTLKKAIKSGRLKLPQITEEQAKTKSHRSIENDNQGMGKACINTIERVLAAKLGQTCPTKFESQIDLTNAGILMSLPSLLSNGLLRYSEDYEKVGSGYYSVESVFMSLAFLALLRVKTISQSAYMDSGELGRAMGLDRIPEVRTLRKRINLFSKVSEDIEWPMLLSRDWMQNFPELAGIAYIDGHINIYCGEKTQMPKRYVSRMRLCMSGSTDYWVNDMTGQPFFVLNKAVNGSMIQTIKEDILPRLDREVPNQPSKEELKENKYQCRYMIVFDRECYSPDFFHDLWINRVAICTYNKNVKDKWDDEEFTPYQELSTNGEKNEILLAERGVLLQNNNSEKKIWAREIRKKSDSGHQTSIITTHFLFSIIQIGFYMFARWTQENFFQYMMENFNIDTLVSYSKEKISDTTRLINPEYRKLETEQKKLISMLNHRKIKFGSIALEYDIEEKQTKRFLNSKAELLDEIKNIEADINRLKQKKATIPRKIAFAELPESEKFDNVINSQKHFIDAIKLIAYRGETGMANIIKPIMPNADEARALLKQIYKSDANIYPDYENNILNIEIHCLSTWKDDKKLKYLCEVLNQTETAFPGTNLILIYKMVSFNNP
jgi:hypothetical protein